VFPYFAIVLSQLLAMMPTLTSAAGGKFTLVILDFVSRRIYGRFMVMEVTFCIGQATLMMLYAPIMVAYSFAAMKGMNGVETDACVGTGACIS
jgi:uncharacterized protein (DUF983 family)